MIRFSPHEKRRSVNTKQRRNRSHTSRQRLPFTRLTVESLESRRLLTTTISDILHFDLNEFITLEGANSSLTRSEDAVTLRVSTNNLPAGLHRLSVAAFSNPDLCTADCDLQTDSVPEVGASHILGADVTVGEDGLAEFVVAIPEGANLAVQTGTGIVDAGKAEIGFVIHSCDNESQCPDPATTAPLQKGVHINPETVVTAGPANIWDHPGGKNDIPIPNTTTRITRYDDRIALRFDTVALTTDHVYTFWLAAFNAPDGCSSSPLCTPSEFPEPPFTGPDQMGRPESRPSLLNITGQWVRNEEGTATFTGERQVGDLGGVVLFGPAVEDAWAAELHTVIRTHGVFLEDPPTAQLTTFTGGCQTNQCGNLQLAASHGTQAPAPAATMTDHTSSGFWTEFSTELDESVLNLYDSELAGLGGADVIVEGVTTGRVAGSLILGPGRTTFVKSGGPLAADTYTVTLRSADDGFKSMQGGLLKSLETDTAGDFVTSFTVDPPPADAVAISIPDFVRGPGQTVEIPAGSDGLPVVVSNAEGVTNVDFEIRYDPQLLEIASASVASGMPEGAAVDLNITTPGSAVVSFSSPAPLASGTQTLVSLEASIPSTAAIQGQQQLLDIHSAVVSDSDANSLPVIEDDAVHVAGYFADVTGNGVINGSDASRLARVVAVLDSGFQANPLTAPTILADISGNGLVNALDASLVAQHAALLDVSEIPPIPSAAPAAAALGPAAGPTLLYVDLSSPDVSGAADEGDDTTDNVEPTLSSWSSGIVYPAVDAVFAEAAAPSVTSTGGAELELPLEEALEELLQASE